MAAVVVDVSCTPAAPPTVAKAPVAPSADGGKADPVGARWALDWSDPASAGTKLALADGATLIVGESGERWLSKEGSFENASTLLPEAIASVQKFEGGFRFIGRAGGATYVAHDPLGPATKTSDGVKEARKVAVGKIATLAIDAKGDLLRTMDGKSWTKVAIPQQSGVVVHLAMHEAEGMIVLAPQRIFGTKDDGATWTAARSPGVGIKDVSVVGDALVLTGLGDEEFRFNPAWATFTKNTATAASDDKPSGESSSLVLKRRLVDGDRALEVHVDASGREHVWTVSVGPVGGKLERHQVPEMAKCEYVNADMMGDTIEISCDIEADIPRPDGGLSVHSIGYLMKLLRSDDAGKTFRVETTIAGGPPEKQAVDHEQIDAPLAIGAGGFVYVGRRCAKRECLPARVRASLTAEWQNLGKGEGNDDDEDDDAPLRHLRFTRTGGTLYSVGITGTEAQLYRWKNGQPEALVVISHEADGEELPTLSMDDDGTARGFVPDTTDYYRTFEWHDGSPVKYLDLPSSTRAVFSGKHGFAVNTSLGGAFETSDGGRTWAPVLAPSSLQFVTMCSANACVAAQGVNDPIGGYRIGWDGVSGHAAEKPKENAPQFAKPLRCATKDAWVSIGTGALPSVGNVGHGTARWVLPVRNNGAVSLLSNKRGDPPTKTSSVVLMEPAAAKYTATATVTLAQGGGFVAVRYASVRDPKNHARQLGSVNVSLAWLRDGATKVVKATPPPVSALSKDGKDADYDGATYLPELVTLGPKGVYFHPRLHDDDIRDSEGNALQSTPLYLLRDDGKTESGQLPEVDDGEPWHGTVGDATMTLVAIDSSGNFAGAIDGRPKLLWSVSAGLPSTAATVELFGFGGKPTVVTTFRGDGYPPTAWATPLGTGADMLPSTPLATQKSLGDEPKACDAASFADPKAYEYDAPYVRGSRHPVVVDIDGIAQVLATEYLRVRVNASGDACAVTMSARRATSVRDDNNYVVLAYPDDIANAMLFRATKGSGVLPQLSMRPLECGYVAGPLPPELKGAPGFEAP